MPLSASCGQSMAPFKFPDSGRRTLFSQEFQFTYTGSKWQGVAGFYYMKANAFNEFDVLANLAGGLSLYTLDDIDTKTYATFADVSYNVTVTVRL